MVPKRTDTTTFQPDQKGLGQVASTTTAVTFADPFPPEVQDPQIKPVTLKYDFDEFGRLKGTKKKTGDAPDQQQETYKYDALDRRDSRTKGDKTFDLSYIGSSEQLSEEQQLDGDDKRDYDYDSQGDRLGIEHKTGPSSGGVYKAFNKDADGSVENLEGADGEADSADYQYDDYGAGPDQRPRTDGEPNQPDNLSDDAAANPFRFQDHYLDQDSDTYDMQARPYAPDVGRFLTEDRYEGAAGDLALQTDPLTQGRFSFAGGNPIGGIEFDGHAQNPCGPTTCKQTKITAKRDAAPQNPDAGDDEPAPRSEPTAPEGDGGKGRVGKALERYVASVFVNRIDDLAPPLVPLLNDIGFNNKNLRKYGPNGPYYSQRALADDSKEARDEARTRLADQPVQGEFSDLFTATSLLAGPLVGAIRVAGAETAGALASRGGGEAATKAGNVLPKPIVNDSKLQNYINDLYKGTTNPNRVGTGTTADAVRAERATGQATGGKFHTQKAEDTAGGLGNFLRRNPGANPRDRLVAQSLRDELLDALGRGAR